MALYGINLGGWFILERWMTPTLFDGTDAIDEYTFMQTPGAEAKLRKHHDTFITGRDFNWMAKNGVNIVRIPVGYWILNGDTPYVNSITRLDWAFETAAKYKIKVLLDIHGLPGSQNGRDHSGQVCKPGWKQQSANVQKGLTATLQLAERYAQHPALWGMQIMNEPPVRLLNIHLRRYYNQAYNKLIKILPAHVAIVYSDAFMPRLMNGAIKNNKRPVYMDIHWYHFAGYGWARPKLYNLLITWRLRLIKRLKRRNGVIIGEWSGAYSQKIFDKYPTNKHDAIVIEHIASQMRTYEAADAWFYWTYKTEKPGVWNFKSLVDDGKITLKNQ